MLPFLLHFPADFGFTLWKSVLKFVPFVVAAAAVLRINFK